MGKRKSSYLISPILPTVYHRQWNMVGLPKTVYLLQNGL